MFFKYLFFSSFYFLWEDRKHKIRWFLMEKTNGLRNIF